MNKQALRYIAVGFLASSILLSGYDFLSGDSESSKLATEENAEDYKKLYEDLLAEIEISNLSEAEKQDPELDTSAEKQNDPEETDEENTETVVQSTIIIEDGQPSSVATTQLVNQGIVESGSDFDTFMDSNGYTTKIKPGRFSVDNSMSFEEIAQALIN